MKKHISALLISALLVTGYTQPARITLAAGQNEETDIEETQVSVSYREEAQASWEARLDYDGSGLDEIPYVVTNYNESFWRITDIDVVNEGYEDLAAAVDDFESSVISEYTCHTIYTLYRCDNRILSLGVDSAESVPDEDDMFMYTPRFETRTFDYQGNVLLFTDIVNDDYDYFMSAASSVIREEFGRDADEMIEGLEAIDDPDSIKFYMGADSMVIFLEDIVGYWETIKIDYKTYADVFDPKYLPGDGTLVSQVFDPEDGYYAVPAEHDDLYDDGHGYFYVSYGDDQGYILAGYMSTQEALRIVDHEYYQESGRLMVIYTEDYEEVGEERLEYPLDGLAQSYWSVERILNFTDNILNED